MRARLAAAVVAGVVALVGCSAGGAERTAPPGDPGVPAEPPPPEPTTTTATVAEDVRSFEAPRDYRPVPLPVAVGIPAIGVSSPLEVLHRNPDGTIQVPSWHVAGWWADGPRPGQPGPAVILGHVDTREGPDVFYRLRELVAGDEVVVTREDGSQVTFIVDRVERHPKDEFPTEAVYAPSLQPGLRLVTCGGSFDTATGHYRDNVIAFASVAPPDG